MVIDLPTYFSIAWTAIFSSPLLRYQCGEFEIISSPGIRTIGTTTPTTATRFQDIREPRQ